MTTTVIAVFGPSGQIEEVRNALRESGCGQDDILIFGGAHGSSDDGAMRREFEGVGLGAEDVAAFVGAVAKGAVIVSVDLGEEDKADAVASILERHGAKGVDRHRSDGGGARIRGERETLREVEETVEVGKEKTIRGGIQARTRVTERPVEKTVTLREEQVDVARREADRDLSPEEAKRAFEERSVEVTATAEEAKVRKAAHLIGEVVVSKSATDREETVRETARRTEVEVEPVRAGGKPEAKKD